jgi:hypothetical protein
MEYMGGGCLTEILEQFEDVQMTEGNIAWVCQEVRFRPSPLTVIDELIPSSFVCFLNSLLVSSSLP